MSIATELQNLNDNILDAYDAVQAKGGTIPANKNMANLDTAINSIPAAKPYYLKRELSGSTELRIAKPVEDTETFAPLPDTVTYIDAYAMAMAYAKGFAPKTVDLSHVSDIGEYGLYMAFCGAHSWSGNSLESLDMSSLASISKYGMSRACEFSNLKNISFPELTTVYEHAFDSAFFRLSSPTTSASFPKLTNLSNYAFYEAFATSNGNTSGVISASFDALATIDNNDYSCFESAFDNDKALTSFNFPALTKIQAPSAFNSAFSSCSSLTNTDGFSELKEISGAGIGYSHDKIFYRGFAGSGITEAEFKKLETIDSNQGFYNAFTGCASLEQVRFPALTTLAGTEVFGYGFYYIQALTSISFPALTTISANKAFSYACSSSHNLSSIDFSSLTTISGPSAFDGAFGNTALTTVSFPALTTADQSSIFKSAFQNCASLTTVSFPSLTTTIAGAWTNMLRGCTGVTVHFPAAMQSTMGSWSDVTGGFGGTNTTVLFDL